jgi:hypothetical protein
MDINSLPITFMHNNDEINGFLNGTWYDWKFTSDSETFVSNFREGLLTRKVLLYGSDDPRLPLVEATLTAIDKVLG